MYWGYAVIPFVAWLVAGSLKFAINSVKAGKPAFGLVGYGGLPSNHSAIVSSVAALVAFREGIGHPAFGVAVGVCFVVMLDAASLRRQIGRQAQAINWLIKQQGGAAANETLKPLRERMGHTPVEIGAGIVVGVVVAQAFALSFEL